MAKKQIKQSETIEIKRSQINLNPFNPKRHTDKKVQEQKKNLQRVGFLGGITWNQLTGNLIDGHRRIKAMDLYYGYDGTPATDYSVKVESVEFDEKQEKEQMTYMALSNTKADYQLIAEYLPGIDYSAAGIDDYDLAQIQSFIPSVDDTVQIESIDGLIAPAEEPGSKDGDSHLLDEKSHLSGNPDDTVIEADSDNLTSTEPTPEEKKAKIKEAKQKQIEAAEERYSDLTAYLTVSFDSAEEKRMFCELAGISENEKFIRGSKVLEMIE